MERASFGRDRWRNGRPGQAILESLETRVHLSAYFYDVRIADVVDLDGDGFSSQFVVEWDVDADASLEVLVDVWEVDPLFDDRVTTSEAWLVSGDEVDWRGVAIDVEDVGLPGDDDDGEIELRLDLIDAATLQIIHSIDGGLLSGIFVETEFDDNVPPSVPGRPYVLHRTHESAVIAWDESNDSDGHAISYQVEYRESGVSEWTLLAVTTESALEITNLDVAAIYDIRVAAVDERLAQSGWSDGEDDLILPAYVERRASDGGVSFQDPAPDRGVWIVIHGRSGSPHPGQEHEKNVSRLADAMADVFDQVYTVDWSTLAAASGRTDFSGEQWIVPVAEQVASEIRQWGLDSSDVNLLGHSWGAVVAGEIARALEGVGAVIALDPAENAFAPFGSSYDTDDVHFSAYSRHSWAFVSSRYGSTESAASADESYVVADPNQSGSEYESENGEWADVPSHSEVVSAFAILVESIAQGDQRGIGALFDPRYVGVERGWIQDLYDADDLGFPIYARRDGAFDGVIGTSIATDGSWAFDELIVVDSETSEEVQTSDPLAIGNPSDVFASLVELHSRSGLIRGDWIIEELSMLVPQAAAGQGYWGAENFWFQNSSGDVLSLWHGGDVHESSLYEGEHDWILTNLTSAAGLQGQFDFEPGSLSGIVTGWNAFNIQGVIDGRLVALWWSPASSAGTYVDVDGSVKQGSGLGLNGNGWSLSDLSGALRDPDTGETAGLDEFYPYTSSQGHGRTLFDPRLENASGDDGMSIVVVHRLADIVYLVSFNSYQLASVLAGEPGINGAWLLEPLRDVPSLAGLVTSGLIERFEAEFVELATSV